MHYYDKAHIPNVQHSNLLPKQGELFDEEASILFCYMKLHAQVATANNYSLGQNLCMPIGSVLDANSHTTRNFSLNLAVKKPDHLKSSSDLYNTVDKHSALINLIKIPEYVEKCPHILVPATTGKINKGVFTEGKLVMTQHNMFVDDNLLEEVRAHLNPTLDFSTESLCMVLGDLDMPLRNNPLSKENTTKIFAPTLKLN